MQMKTIAFSEFRRNASKLLDRVEKGETLLVERHGRPVAEIAPAPASRRSPSWKQPYPGLITSGKSLSRMVIEERESGW